jgi:phytol kinase
MKNINSNVKDLKKELSIKKSEKKTLNRINKTLNKTIRVHKKNVSKNSKQLNLKNKNPKIHHHVHKHYNILKSYFIRKLFKERREIFRQIFHLFYGLFVVYCLSIFDKFSLIFSLSLLIVLGMFISSLSKNKDIFIISSFLKFFDRDKDRIKFPGKGAIFITLGFLLSILFFDTKIAEISIIILTFGDSFSTIFGRLVGKTHPFGVNKTIEGTMGGVLAATIASSFYLPFSMALIISGISMFSEYFETKLIDDNILIPLVCGVLLTFVF